MLSRFFARTALALALAGAGPGQHSGLLARLRDKRSVGAVVRLTLVREDGEGLIEAELSRERCEAERWREGELVWVRPNRVQSFERSVH